MIKLFFLSLISVTYTVNVASKNNADDIMGRWINTENNLEVEIYKTGQEYRGKVIWIDDSDDKNRPMNGRCDWKNPDEALRKQKIIGLVVMYGLIYNEQHNNWQGGRIYDPSSGKDWNAKASITRDGYLKVRGYWDFELLGKDLLFKKGL
ncbi:MAG: DUF2147 domain-containing protein [Bacteroidota bacterium]|nr:DUF2147 domain-containing protein [Bacteroidota bacterium]